MFGRGAAGLVPFSAEFERKAAAAVGGSELEAGTEAQSAEAGVLGQADFRERRQHAGATRQGAAVAQHAVGRGRRRGAAELRQGVR